MPCAACDPPHSALQVVPVLLGSFERISSVRIFMPDDLRSKDVRQGFMKSIEEIHRRFPDGLFDLAM